jgi:hypothetical protein
MITSTASVIVAEAVGINHIYASFSSKVKVM